MVAMRRDGITGIGPRLLPVQFDEQRNVLIFQNVDDLQLYLAYLLGTEAHPADVGGDVLSAQALRVLPGHWRRIELAQRQGIWYNPNSANHCATRGLAFTTLAQAAAFVRVYAQAQGEVPERDNM